MTDYVVVDLETTGVSCDTSEIIEIGAWKIKDGIVKDKFSSFIKPYMYIPRAVQNLTGITMEDVKDCETVEKVLIEFYDWCEGYPFLGHNLFFDYNFLKSKGKTLGVDFTRQGIDTLALCKKYFSFSSYKLENLVSELNINVTGSEPKFHRAYFDAYATKLVYDRLLFKFPKQFDIINPVELDKRESKYGEAVITDVLDFK